LATRVERIIFKTEWDTSGATKGAGIFKKATDGVLGGLGKMTQGLGGFAAMAGPAFAIAAAKKFLDVLKEIGVQMFELTKESVKLAAAYEQTLTGFTVFLNGSSEAAQKLTDDLEVLSLKTPLTPEALNEVTTTLLNFGVAADDKLIPTLTSLGDVAQGNEFKFKRLALAFGQVSSLGRLQGQDLLQMVNVGWNPLQQIAEKTGETMEELRVRMAAGDISIDEVKDALVLATSEGGRFFGAMSKQSETLTGRLSTLEGATNKLKREFGQAFLPAVKVVTDQLINFAESGGSITEALKIIGPPIGKLTFSMIELTKAMASIMDGFTSGGKAMGLLEEDATNMDAVVSLLVWSMEAMAKMTNRVANNLLEYAEAFEQSLDFLRGIGEAMDELIFGIEKTDVAVGRLSTQVNILDEATKSARDTIKEASKDVISFGFSIASLGENIKALKKEQSELDLSTASGRARYFELGAEIDRAKAIIDRYTKRVKKTVGTINLHNEAVKKLKDEQGKLNLETEAGRERFSEINDEISINELNIRRLTGEVKELGVESVKTMDNLKSAFGVTEDFDPFSELPKRSVESIKETKAATEEEIRDWAKNIRGIAKKDMTDLIADDIEAMVAKIEQALQGAKAIAETAFKAIGDLQQVNTENDLKNLDKQKEARLEVAKTDAERAKIEKQFADQREKLEKEAFQRQKEFAKAQAIINGALAVTKILAEAPKLDGGILTAILIAAAIAQTAAQVATIEAQEFAEGGYVTGGVKGKDSVNAILMPEEYVLTTGATKKLGKKNLDRMLAGDPSGLFGALLEMSGMDISGMIDNTKSMDDSRILSALTRHGEYLQKIAKKDYSPNINISNAGTPVFNRNRRRTWN